MTYSIAAVKAAYEKKPTTAREHAGDICLKAAALLSIVLGLNPELAYAVNDSGTMLTQTMNMLQRGVSLLGGVLVVFGLVNLGMSLKDGAQGGGGQLAGAIAMIIGGAVIVGASIYFGDLATEAGKLTTTTTATPSK